jgi:hypothetical protein
VGISDDARVHVNLAVAGQTGPGEWPWSLALLAGPGQVTLLDLREGLAVAQPVDAHPGDTQQLVRVVLAKRHVVFGHAGHHAGAAARALVEVDHHPVPFNVAVLLIHSNTF